MPQFLTLTQAFEWFLENVYPELPPEKKTNALRVAKSTYYKGDKGVSDKKIKSILEEFCDYQLMHDIQKKSKY